MATKSLWGLQNASRNCKIVTRVDINEKIFSKNAKKDLIIFLVCNILLPDSIMLIKIFPDVRVCSEYE